MNVFRVAVLKGAIKVIMAHNHPSGEIKPSEADKDLTDRLIQVGRILNIKVIDHMIVSARSYLSFSDTGLLTELELSAKWVPQFELIEQIRKEEKKIREQAVKTAETRGAKKGKIEGLKEGHIKGEKDKAVDVARGMKIKGYSTEDIIELTGLKKEEIEKL